VQEKDIYVESILADCKKLGADIDKVTYTSNYFPQLLDLAERLIKAGHLYADDTPQETMKEVGTTPPPPLCNAPPPTAAVPRSPALFTKDHPEEHNLGNTQEGGDGGVGSSGCRMVSSHSWPIIDVFKFPT